MIKINTKKYVCYNQCKGDIMRKIYVIGTVGTGKTTLAKRIATEYNLNHYELDNIVWKAEDSKEIRRDDKEVEELFNGLIMGNDWVLDDVGRPRFNKALDVADVIIYLDIPKRKRNYQILKRWIKQNLRLENSRYKPSVRMLIQMYKWSSHDDKKREEVLLNLYKYQNKVIIVKDNDFEGINKLL